MSSNSTINDVHNRTLIAYAPADNPEVAISVVVPQGELASQSHPISLQIGERAMQAYFDLKKERANIQNNTVETDELTVPADEQVSADDSN